MNILEIDCVSFATRVAHVAAGELYALLAYDGKAERIDNWFDVAGNELTPEEMEAVVSDLGAYVSARGVVEGERLWNHLAGLSQTDTGWRDLRLAQRQAFGLFVTVCRRTHLNLIALQEAAETADAAAAQRPAPLKLEDSIFEPVGGLGELRKESIGAAVQIARGEEKERAAKEKAAEAAKKTAAEQKARAGKGKTLSAGEKPAGKKAAPKKTAAKGGGK